MKSKIREIDNFTYNLTNGILVSNKSAYKNVNLFYVNNYGEVDL